MNVLYEFFQHIATNYGTTTAIIAVLLILTLAGMAWILKTFPDILKTYFEKKASEAIDLHKLGASRRKSISPEIIRVLSKLVLNTDSTKATLFEFSNGTSNLAGLPFLFINATSEVLTVGASSTSQAYQRVNISLMADFIIELEDRTYIIIDNVDCIQNKYPYIYSMLKSIDTKCAVFYSIYGVDDNLGFIVLESDKDCIVDKKNIMPEVAEAAQKISALLSFEDIDNITK